MLLYTPSERNVVASLLVHLNFKMHQQKTHTSKILRCAPENLDTTTACRGNHDEGTIPTLHAEAFTMRRG
jgi:hypothetical protein